MQKSERNHIESVCIPHYSQLRHTTTDCCAGKLSYPIASQMNFDTGNGGGGGVQGGDGRGGFTSGSNKDAGKLHPALPTAA